MRKEISEIADQILKEISFAETMNPERAELLRLIIQNHLSEAFFRGQLEGIKGLGERLEHHLAFEPVSALQNGAQKRIGESLVDARNLCGTQPELQGSLTGSKANKSE
jgi:hypothetical protein